MNSFIIILATVGGNRPTTVRRPGEGLAGYFDKHGFNPHT